MTAYKLFTLRKNGELSSLFINKQDRLPINKWLTAKLYPTPGFKERFGWHCCPRPKAPHLSNRNRAWYKIEIKNFKELTKPKNQGGKWFLARKMRILNKV